MSVHLGHRIQVVPVTGPQPPVQTGTITVVRMALNRSPCPATFDLVTRMQGCPCRFKGRDQVPGSSVPYRYHRFPRHCAGKDDGPRFRRQYQCIVLGGQIHPPMPRKPVMRRSVELPDRLRRLAITRGPDRTHPPSPATLFGCTNLHNDTDNPLTTHQRILGVMNGFHQSRIREEEGEDEKAGQGNLSPWLISCQASFTLIPACPQLK